MCGVRYRRGLDLAEAPSHRGPRRLTRRCLACATSHIARTWAYSVPAALSTPDEGPPLRRPRLHWEPFQQPAGDDEPLDLVRAFAHGEELGVAEVALNGQLLDVAYPAVDLHGLAGEELGHACLEVAALACRLERGRLVGQELGLDELVLRDGLTKGLTLLCIAD